MLLAMVAGPELQFSADPESLLEKYLAGSLFQVNRVIRMKSELIDIDADIYIYKYLKMCIDSGVSIFTYINTFPCTID